MYPALSDSRQRMGLDRPTHARPVRPRRAPGGRLRDAGASGREPAGPAPALQPPRHCGRRRGHLLHRDGLLPGRDLPLAGCRSRPRAGLWLVGDRQGHPLLPGHTARHRGRARRAAPHPAPLPRRDGSRGRHRDNRHGRPDHALHHDPAVEVRCSASSRSAESSCR